MARWLSTKGLFFFPPEPLWRLEYSIFLLLALLCWTAVSSYTEIYIFHGAERLDFAGSKLLRRLLLWAIVTTGSVFFLPLGDVRRQFALYVVFVSGLLISLRTWIEMMVLR